jgi:hypothetical protein
MKKYTFALVFGFLLATFFVNAQAPCTTCGDPVITISHHSVEAAPGKIFNFYSDGKNFKRIHFDGSVEKIETGLEAFATPVTVTKPIIENTLDCSKTVTYIILVFEDKDGRSYNAYYNLRDEKITAITGF